MHRWKKTKYSDIKAVSSLVLTVERWPFVESEMPLQQGKSRDHPNKLSSSTHIPSGKSESLLNERTGFGQRSYRIELDDRYVRSCFPRSALFLLQ